MGCSPRLFADHVGVDSLERVIIEISRDCALASKSRVCNYAFPTGVLSIIIDENFSIG